MKVCHVCKAECDDAAELCPVCGADLTAEITEEEEKEEKVINTPVLRLRYSKTCLRRRVFFTAAIPMPTAQ